jgi:NAD(P)H-nitrite reductase large subunit
MGMRLDDRYHGMELPNKMKMGVSGCTNNCAENCIKDIALMGKKKGWNVTAGGNGAKKPRLADLIAEELDDDAAIALIDRIIDCYRETGKKGERIGQMIDRIGLESFKEALNAA